MENPIKLSRFNYTRMIFSKAVLYADVIYSQATSTACRTGNSKMNNVNALK